MKQKLLLPFVVLLFFISCILTLPVYAADDIKIGVLAYKGKDDALKMWGPTADYLSSAMPGRRVVIMPLGFDEIGPAVGRGDVDFVIANTAIYVGLEAEYGITRIATMKNRNKTGYYTAFGGVIFRRADRADIKDIKDLKGRKFIAVDSDSLGGWLAACREFKATGLDPLKDFASLEFGQTHGAVVNAVREGRADAGTIRTDILERMAQEGKIDLKDFHVLGAKYSAGFPFLLSTQLYPEWPFAKAKNAPAELAELVAVALLKMKGDSPAARAANIAGWTIPLNYEPVHDLMKELRVGPYKEYGKITLAGVVNRYWHWLVLMLLALVGMAFATVHVARLNRKLRQTQGLLEEARNGLELRVKEQVGVILEREASLRTAMEETLVAKSETEASRAFLHEVINDIVDPLLVINTEYGVEMMNTAARSLFLGVSNLSESPLCYDVIHRRKGPCGDDKERCPLDEILAKKKPVNVVHNHIDDRGLERFIEIHASPVLDDSGRVVRIIELCRDITEKLLLEKTKKQLEERIRWEQKEQSMTTIAGGVAHEFNNALTGVLGNAEILQMRFVPGTPEEALALRIISASRHMAGLTKQLLSYAKGGFSKFQRASVQDLIHEALGLSDRGKSPSVTVEVKAEGKTCPVQADPAQLTQVFLNLFTNAFEAMDKPSGRLDITISVVKARPSWACVQCGREHPAGDYVKVVVSDTGHGMSEETRQRIFEPFFTTRFFGRGLGLSAAIGIIQGHGGCIEAQSSLGEGATFTVYLPCLNE